MQLKYIILIFLLIPCGIKAEKGDNVSSFLYFPKAYKNFDYNFGIGLNLTRLPQEVVEEEINQSPVLNFDARLGIPANLSLLANFHSNYIVNSGSLGLQWTLISNDFSFAVGLEYQLWFGHVDFRAIQMKNNGFTYYPFILFGKKFEDFIVSLRADAQFSRVITHDGEDNFLSDRTDNQAGYSIELSIEQPLWKDNWAAISVKINYARFYYQSWLSFNTLNEYLIYPEFSFMLIL